MMVRRVIASVDASMQAILRGRLPLRYAAGPDPTLDRPAHVRSGSALASFAGRIAVVQDDAHFLALVDVSGRSVDAITFGPGEGGKRLYDARRGNKALKLDLEACFVCDGVLVAFGSGSTAKRERCLLVRQQNGDFESEIVDAGALYRALREAHEFSGSQLNLEGAVCRSDGRVVLFQRGNGAPMNGLLPRDATLELELAELMAFLARRGSGAPPRLFNVTEYELGNIDGVRLTFTDAATFGNELLFLAAAEASPDALLDGPVSGVALGLIDERGEARWTPVVDSSGQRVSSKLEGLWLDRLDRAYAVSDPDDPDAPSELCELELVGVSAR
jgi:Family of unknown function (DUF6929)